MYNIDTASAVGSMPTPAGAGTAGWFDQNTPWTATSADWANGIQAELLNILIAGGVTKDKAATDQILEALRSLTFTKLSADLDVYISTTGNDSNAGTIGAPFLTLQAAWNHVQSNINVNGYSVTFHVADGTYTAGVTCVGSFMGAFSGIYFVGNTSTPANCIINVTNGACFVAVQGAPIHVNGFKLVATGTSGNEGLALSATSGGVIVFDEINFGAARGHITAGTAGFIQCNNGSYTISGNADSHMLAEYNGNIQIDASTVTLTGTPAFTTFADALATATITTLGTTYIGSATGVRYSAYLNSIIATNGGGASFYPGNSSGSTLNGGQYV